VGLPDGFDPAAAYEMMVRMRLVEGALVTAWHDGVVPGEYHSGIGEEGINAGVVLHLSGRDTMALDHRNTAPLIARGADPAALMLEVLGSDQGMNKGQAGHMHVLEPDVHAAADGMVGASGPLAVGNAIANTRLHPGRVAIAFHGEAAMNQGMLMEAYNMAVAWNLPVIFVCKDNKWSITTYSSEVTGGTPVQRARAFGLPVETADGARVQSVYAAAGKLINRARSGGGPGFLYVTCHRPGGHFEGDPLVMLLRTPKPTRKEYSLKQLSAQIDYLRPEIQAGATAASGGSQRARVQGLTALTTRVARAARDWTVRSRMDPMPRARRLIDVGAASRIEQRQQREIAPAIAAARDAVADRPVFGLGSGGAR
jgi:hypothetical protein